MEKIKSNAINIISVLLLVSCAALLINQIKINNTAQAILNNKQRDEIKISWYEPTTVMEKTTNSSEELSNTKSAQNADAKKYVINKSSKKFHEEDCRFAKTISDENRIVAEVNNAEELEKTGYFGCSSCQKWKSLLILNKRIIGNI